MFASFFQIIEQYQWNLSLSYTNPMFWVLGLSYFWAAYLSFKASKAYEVGNSKTKVTQRIILFWRTIAYLLLGLGIIELLDLQLLLTHTVRQFSKAAGWYHQRQPFQKQIIWSIITLSSLFFFSGLIFIRRVLFQKLVALCGIAFLCGFIGVRAVSYHHVDSFLEAPVWNFVQMKWCIEFLAISCIGISAGFTYRISAEKASDLNRILYK